MRFDELPKAYLETWKKYAIARANREMLEESKKSVLASEASKYEWSEATRERLARKSEEYRKYLLWLQKALQTELELKYELDSLNMQFEYQRSMNALRKAETKIL